jgi:hypothetical protein
MNDPRLTENDRAVLGVCLKIGRETLAERETDRPGMGWGKSALTAEKLRHYCSTGDYMADEAYAEYERKLRDGK